MSRVNGLFVAPDFSTTTAVGSSLQDYLERLHEAALSLAPAYLGNGEIDTVTYYKSATQVQSNRVALVQVTYDVDLNPTVETWNLYDKADGTTVLKTIVINHTYNGSGDLTKSEWSVS